MRVPRAFAARGCQSKLRDMKPPSPAATSAKIRMLLLRRSRCARAQGSPSTRVGMTPRADGVCDAVVRGRDGRDRCAFSLVQTRDPLEVRRLLVMSRVRRAGSLGQTLAVAQCSSRLDERLSSYERLATVRSMGYLCLERVSLEPCTRRATRGW